MDHSQIEQREAANETKLRAEWMKPEVVAFEAGLAEAGDFIAPDGNIAS